MKTRLALCLLLAGALAAVPVWAQRKGSASGVTARVVPTNWRGACPHGFQFTATLRARTPGTVYYVWERSDNSSGPRQSTTFAKSGESKVVRTEWTPNSPGTGTLNGWARLQVEDGPRSTPARFVLQCRSGK